MPLITIAFSLVLGLEVVNVHDGDTVLFKTDEGLEVKGRLIGIDCPEVPHKDRRGKKKPSPGQPMGLEARDRLKDLLKSPFKVKSFGTDAYGRSLVWIDRVQNGAINEVLVAEGYCEVYRSSRKTKGFDPASVETAEKKAKTSKVGIWALPNYESPGQYRKRFRN